MIAEAPFVEVWGVSFDCEKLYELVGKDHFMLTFVFKTDTEASSKFGQSVTGVIFYDKDELEVFEKFNKEPN